jgi:hypothetical protein
MRDALMRAEVLRSRGNATSLQVGWRCTQHRAASGDSTRHHTFVQAIGDTDGQINAFIDQIDRAVHGEQFDLDARIAALKLHDRARQARDGERQARREPQFARGLRSARTGDGLYVRGQLEHLAQSGQRLLPGIAQAHAAGGAMQQPRAEPLLQTLEMAADHGPRQVQHFGCAGQAPLVGNLDEGSDGTEVVHGLSRFG